MSSGILLDLPSEKDLKVFTEWVTTKWRPLWYWHMTRQEALHVAEGAIALSERSWRPGCGSNKTTWAINAARFEYLNRMQPDQRWNERHHQADYDYERMPSRDMESAKSIDLETIMGILKERLRPKEYAVLSARTTLKYREIAEMYGVSKQRIQQIEANAIAKSRRILAEVMAKNNCTDIHELY